MHCSLVNSFLHETQDTVSTGFKYGLFGGHRSGAVNSLESPAAVAGQCRERGELQRYPAGTRTSSAIRSIDWQHLLFQ